MTDDDWYARYRREVEFAHALSEAFRTKGKIECQIYDTSPPRPTRKEFYKIKLNPFEAPQ